MDEIFFPSQYKKAVLLKTKNATIRIGKEMGKYKTGKIYSAKSYAGNDWSVKIKISSVTKTKLGQLSEYGIPKRSVEATQRKEKVSLNEPVEVIRFTVL
jgi:uncharacterized protein YqfB (UPF0267 family)